MLVVENGDHLQQLLYQFNKTAKRFKMVISAAKTKSLVTSKSSTRWKLMVDDKIIHKKMKLKYLEIEIAGY